MTGSALADRALAALPEAPGYVLALSGGMDSVALLSLLAGRVPLRAVHVEHGLQAAAREWPEVCAALCERFAVPFRSLAVTIAPPPANREAWAREQRYALLAAELRAGEVLLTAHHADDQAETVLLNLLRGSGLAGLAGMPDVRALGGGRLARPLLGITRAELRAHCAAQGLAGVIDWSNRDPSLDRNFLRHEILPRLRQRWPAAGRTLARSAAQLAADRDVYEEMADQLLVEARDASGGLRLTVLARYSVELRAALLRRWLSVQGLPAPRARQWPEIWRQLLDSTDDRQVELAWPGVRLRRYRGGVHVVAEAPPARSASWDLSTTLEWPGFGVLVARAWPQHWPRPVLQVRPPAGGERIRLQAGGPRRRVKNLWQEAGVPPWQRQRSPLFYRDGELVAVGDRWIAATAAGLSIERLSAE